MGRKGIDYSQEVRGRNGYVHDDKNTLYAYIKSQRIIKKLPWTKLFHYITRIKNMIKICFTNYLGYFSTCLSSTTTHSDLLKMQI